MMLKEVVMSIISATRVIKNRVSLAILAERSGVGFERLIAIRWTLLSLQRQDILRGPVDDTAWRTDRELL